MVAVALAASVPVLLQVAQAGTDQGSPGTGQHEAAASGGNADLQRQVNDLRSELLDQRERRIGRQQAGTVVLVVFGIAAGIGGIWALIRFRGGSVALQPGLQAGVLQVRPGRELQAIPVLIPDGTGPGAGTALRADSGVRGLPVAVPLEAATRGVLSPRAAALWSWLPSGYLPGPAVSCEAMPHFDPAMPPDSDSRSNGRGDESVQQFRHEQTVADCSEAIRREPNEARHYRERGDALSELDRHEEALADYDRAIDLDPGNAAAYLGRCHAKADLGRHDEAIDDFEEAVRINPGLATAPEDE